MKKLLIVFAVIIVVLISAAITLPVIFKDDIKEAIDKELQSTINADVLFNVDNFSLSVFTNFPNITATMNEFGIINRAPFEGSILFAAEEMMVEIDVLVHDYWGWGIRSWYCRYPQNNAIHIWLA